MAKLMPGRIRNEGIALYEEGKVEIQEFKDRLIFTRIAGETLRYSLDDDAIFCSCDFFHKKKYCSHLAAVEHFLKTDPSGKTLLEELEKTENDNQVNQEKVSFGSLFLDQILTQDDIGIRYELHATGQEDPLTEKLFWTLRLSRLPDEKSYIVRDIKAFLATVKKASRYQIGKNYYEPLHLENFDEPSRDLITYLLGLVDEGESLVLQNSGRHLYFPSSLFEDGLNRLMNLKQFQFQYSVYDYQEVLFQDLSKESGIFNFEVTEREAYIEVEIEEQSYNRFYSGDFLFYRGVFYQLTPEQMTVVRAIRDLPIDADRKKRLQFDLSEQAKLATGLIEFQKIGQVHAPESLKIHDFDVEFDLDLTEDHQICVKTAFVYLNDRVESRTELQELSFASNFKKEQEVFRRLREYDFVGDFTAIRPALKANEIYRFFTQTIPALGSLGDTRVSERLMELYYVEKPQVTVQADEGLLSIGFSFDSIDQSEIDDALESLFKANDFYISKSGKVIIFDEETKKISETLQELRVKKSLDGTLQANRIAAFQLSELFKDQENIQFSQEFQNLAYDLIHPEAFEIHKPPVQATLRDYQETGVKWFSMLSKYGFGGILADDMGLGKTLQTISFLASKLEKNQHALILAPSSLIYNWMDEFQKFAPQLDVTVSYGLKPVRNAIIEENHQVVITSYASFRQDVEEYEQFNFDYLILDEAQVMKNAQTKIAQYLRNFSVKQTFALSGTPIENNLGEIWSIFEIVLPGLLPSKNQFMKMEAEKVARYIKPFVMRRKKEDVLTELPDLIEIVHRNELADSQKTIYLAQLQQMQERVRTASDEELNRSKMEILSGLMRLRQICDTPALFMDDYTGESGKLESLRELLEQIQAGGHRVLIFSQFRGMLDIIETELAGLGIESFKITGSTPAQERQEMTTAFNQGDRTAFLISLKAGGVGLNLTGADTVILVDLWWNPAVEAQAIGRAHRMGQEQNVEVYRLITRGTIEEKIQELQESKKNLISTVLDGTESRTNMTIDEIREILGVD